MPAEFLCNLPKNLTTHLTHKLYAVFPLFSVFQFFVFCIAYRLAPFVAAVFAGAFHCNVAEPAVLFGTVPVLDLCRNGDYCAGFQADGRLSLLLIPALSGSADQDLSAALGGMVNVPVVPALNWTTSPQSLVVAGFNGIHICALCESVLTSSFCQVIFLFLPRSKPLLQG